MFDGSTLEMGEVVGGSIHIPDGGVSSVCTKRNSSVRFNNKKRSKEKKRKKNKLTKCSHPIE